LIIDLDARFSTSQDAPQDPGLGLNDICVFKVVINEMKMFSNVQQMIKNTLARREKQVRGCSYDDHPPRANVGKARILQMQGKLHAMAEVQTSML
jgi:hypothetical protein